MALEQLTRWRSLSEGESPIFTDPTQKPLDYDLVIVGGGLVGLTLACALKASGLTVALVEASATSAAVARGQAYHVNLLSSRIFQQIGAWEAMRDRVNPIDQIRLSDADFPGTVTFTPADLGTEVLGYVAEHRVVLEGLQATLRDSEHVTYLCPMTVVATEYQSDRAVLQLQQGDQTLTVTTQLVIAADGARSPLRQARGIHTWGWAYWQSCIVAFIQPERSHQNIAYERFWPSGPFAILPLPNNLCRIVWTAPKAEAAAIMAMDETEFLQELQRRYGDQMGELTLVGDRSLFPVQLLHSQRYVAPRLALMGDAAHCCHPVGGQGVNLGFRDAAALAQVLMEAHQRGEDFGTLNVLKRYERWRKAENWVILGFTDLLDRLFSNQIGPIVGVRRLGLLAMQHIPFVKITALKLMTGLLGRSPG